MVAKEAVAQEPRAKASDEAIQAGFDVAKTVPLVIAGVMVAPLIAFALLWTTCLVFIGGVAVLHWLGLA